MSDRNVVVDARRVGIALGIRRPSIGGANNVARSLGIPSDFASASSCCICSSSDVR